MHPSAPLARLGAMADGFTIQWITSNAHGHFLYSCSGPYRVFRYLGRRWPRQHAVFIVEHWLLVTAPSNNPVQMMRLPTSFSLCFKQYMYIARA